MEKKWKIVRSITQFTGANFNSTLYLPVVAIGQEALAPCSFNEILSLEFILSLSEH